MYDRLTEIYHITHSAILGRSLAFTNHYLTRSSLLHLFQIGRSTVSKPSVIFLRGASPLGLFCMSDVLTPELLISSSGGVAGSSSSSAIISHTFFDQNVTFVESIDVLRSNSFCSCNSSGTVTDATATWPKTLDSQCNP